MKTFAIQPFGEYIYEVRDCENMSKSKNPMSNQLINELKISINMLSMSMKDKIDDHVGSKVIVIENLWR